MWDKVFLVYIMMSIFVDVEAGDVKTQLEDIEMKVDAVEDKVGVLKQKVDTIEKNLDKLLQIMKQNFGTDVQDENVVATTPTNGVKGILVAGGNYIDWRKQNAAHVFIPSLNKTCDFPELPEQRFEHSLDTVGNTPVLCGGSYYLNGNQFYFNDRFTIKQICLQLTPPSASGTWSVFAVTRGFSSHSSWNSKAGLILMGGNSELKTEIVTDIGPNFDPSNPPDTIYSFDLVNPFKESCAISLEDFVIITGGKEGYTSFIKNVIQYNLQGFVKNLPDMNEGRAGHGCGSYKTNGKVVLLVAGGGLGVGTRGLYNGYRSSTEKMTLGDQAWTFAKPLPYRLYAPGSVSMDNQVYILAGMPSNGMFSSEVLRFDGEGWTGVGHIKYRLYNAGTTVITMEKEEVEKNCK